MAHRSVSLAAAGRGWGEALPALLTAALLALPTVVAVGSGCRTVKTTLGLGDRVDETAAGTPERVLQDVLRAGLEPDAERAWRRFERLLHSGERTPKALRGWREFRFAALREHVGNYLRDRDKVSYVIARVEETAEGARTYFLESAASDLPTPCTLAPDPRARGAWRVTRCSL